MYQFSWLCWFLLLQVHCNSSTCSLLFLLSLLRTSILLIHNHFHPNYFPVRYSTCSSLLVRIRSMVATTFVDSSTLWKNTLYPIYSKNLLDVLCYCFSNRYPSIYISLLPAQTKQKRGKRRTHLINHLLLLVMWSVTDPLHDFSSFLFLTYLYLQTFSKSASQFFFFDFAASYEFWIYKAISPPFIACPSWKSSILLYQYFSLAT